MTSCSIFRNDIILNKSIQSSLTAPYFTCTAYSLSQITFPYLFILLITPDGSSPPAFNYHINNTDVSSIRRRRSEDMGSV